MGLDTKAKRLLYHCIYRKYLHLTLNQCVFKCTTASGAQRIDMNYK